MARLRKKLPFPELGVPWKMLKGRIINRGQKMPPWRERTVDHGELRLVDGVPVVRVRGNPFQMGKAQGELIGEQTRKLFERYIHVFSHDVPGDIALAHEMEKNLPQPYLEEIRGFGEGSGLGYEEALLGQCFLDIHKVALCSTIAVHDSATTTGEIMLGRNLDFPSLAIAHAASMVICYEPEGGRRFAGVTWPGFLGILSGMNEDGLALAMMLVYGHKGKEHLKGLPFPFVFRRVLAECETVDQAVKFLETRPYCTTTNVMLADKGRHAARLQLHPHKAIVDRSTKEKPALCCTNHFLEKGYRSFAFTWFSSTLRLSRLRKSIASGVPFDEQRIKDVLKKTAIPTINIQRILFKPERLEAEVAIGEVTTAHRKYTKLSRQDLFPVAAPSQKAQEALSSRA